MSEDQKREFEPLYLETRKQLNIAKRDLLQSSDNNTMTFTTVRKFVDANYIYSKAWYEANTEEAIQKSILSGQTTDPRILSIISREREAYEMEMKRWQRASEGLASGDPKEADVALIFKELDRRQYLDESIFLLADPQNREGLGLTEQSIKSGIKITETEIKAYDQARQIIANEFGLPHIKLPALSIEE